MQTAIIGLAILPVRTGTCGRWGDYGVDVGNKRGAGLPQCRDGARQLLLKVRDGATAVYCVRHLLGAPATACAVYCT
jgi:hypothetical protein